MHLKVIPNELLGAIDETDDDAVSVELARLFRRVAFFAFALGASVILLFVSLMGT